MAEKLRINFAIPACPTISGGPLAILEYANRLTARGHRVSVTTYPSSTWSGDNPFPWFDLKAELRYCQDRPGTEQAIHYSFTDDAVALGRALRNRYGVHQLAEAMLGMWPAPGNSGGMQSLFADALTNLRLIEAMPDCDLNIATLWSTASAVYLSGKGKPVYFMQHYEEIFYPAEPATMHSRLGARMSYHLPIYKIANSSWLHRLMVERHGQNVPWSNNGIELADFHPRPKASDRDGVMRIVTYSRPEQWKGFADAAASMQRVLGSEGERVEWHVFGYLHPLIPPDNDFAPYTYHPALSFSKLAELYATSDIALCPSWYESFPLPPLEAMASGTVPVTTQYGTEDYAFHEKNALVVGSRDIESMADCILRLIKNSELRLRLSAEGRRTAETFGWDRAVDARERILWAIHKDEPGYDVMRSARSGLRDAHGIDFELAPSGCAPDASGLYWVEGKLFLLHGGVRRQVHRPELVAELVARGAAYLEVDPLALTRIPVGAGLFSVADLPARIQTLTGRAALIAESTLAA